MSNDAKLAFNHFKWLNKYRNEFEDLFINEKYNDSDINRANIVIKKLENKHLQNLFHNYKYRNKVLTAFINGDPELDLSK